MHQKEINLVINSLCCVRVLRPTNSLGHTETGPRFKGLLQKIFKTIAPCIVCLWKIFRETYMLTTASEKFQLVLK